MPQLKITNYLTNDIMRNVAELYKPHIDKAKEQDPVMTEMFYDIIVPEEGGLREAIANLPQCFVTHDDEFPFRGLYINKLGHHRAFPNISGYELHEFNVRFVSRRVVPSQKFLSHCNMGDSAKVEANDPQWQPFLKMLDNHLFNIKQAETQHKNAELAVMGLLDRYKTVQPILRGVPAFWDLLPPAAQQTISNGEGHRFGSSIIEGITFHRSVYDNPIPHKPWPITPLDTQFGIDVALEHLTMMLVTKKINERA